MQNILKIKIDFNLSQDKRITLYQEDWFSL